VNGALEESFLTLTADEIEPVTLSPAGD